MEGTWGYTVVLWETPDPPPSVSLSATWMGEIAKVL